MRLYFEEKTRVLRQMRQNGTGTPGITGSGQQNLASDGLHLQPAPSTSRNANDASLAEFVGNVFEDF